MGLKIAFTSNQYSSISQNEIELLESIFSTKLPSGSFLVEIEMISTREMQRLNKEYRGIDKSTDVLSFPLLEIMSPDFKYDPNVQYLLGNIVISEVTAKKYQEKIIDLVHHGLLHLLGYDHETNISEWLTVENELLSTYKERNINISGMVYE